MGQKIVVIGGVAGGAGAAAKARRTDENAEIIMFERGQYISFANCGLPYYLGGDVKDRDELFMVSPEQFLDKFNIQVHINHEVVAINREEKTVEVVKGDRGERFTQPYDQLIVATGGRPIVPPIPGIEMEGIFNLWTVQDMDRIVAFIQEKQAQRAAVVGGGFVGLEVVEALVHRGLKTYVLEASPQIFAPFDREMTKPLMDELNNQGVEVILGDGVTQFNGDNQVASVTLGTGTNIPVDLVILAVGVKPDLTLAKETGLEIGEQGGLAVDDRMRTSDPYIYAAGDVVEVNHRVTGKKTRLPLAGPASKEGRVAGANAAGGDLRFKGVVGTSIIKLFRLTAAKTGLNSREADKEGLDYFVSYTNNYNHAHYYPGAEKMSMKLLVEKGSGRLLGAQIVGPKGVDKRIDVLATALMAGMTVDDLADLDLAYSPPYSTVKDPVIMAAYVAGNINEEKYQVINNEELVATIEEEGDELQLIDIRPEEQCGTGDIPVTLRTDVEDVRSCLNQLDPDKKTVLFCGDGYNSYLAYNVLKERGFKEIRNLNGGYQCWCMEMNKE